MDNIRKLSQKYILELILLLLFVVMSFVSPVFFTSKNLINILRNISIQGIIAWAMTLLQICGGIDLSVGAAVGFSGIIVCLAGKNLPVWFGIPLDYACMIGIVVALCVAVLIGCANAFFVTHYKMPAFIVTLAMQYVIYGIAGTLSSGFPLMNLPGWYYNLASKYLFGIFPTCILWFLGIGVIFYIITHLSPFGRKVYAVGGNQEAARLSGINVVKTRYIVMILVQVCASIAGILMASQVMSGQVDYGATWNIQCISAVLVGGASLSGGGGTIKGTLLGMIFIGVLLNAMTIMNFGLYAQFLARGIMILFAVWISIIQSRKGILR